MSVLVDSLEQRVARRLGRAIRLTVHDNRKVMLSFRRRDGKPVSIRLHHLFLTAGADEVRAIARFVRSKHPDARQILARHIRRYDHLIGVRLPEAVARPGKGRAYDLERIFRDLNRRHFGNRVRARIVWGKKVRRERRRTIRLGLYCDAEKKIVISPALDRRSVPRYVVEWIVFHEMLHQVVGFTLVNGAYVAHTPEFRAREQAYPDFARASAWEARNLDRLLRL
ncbi:MAG TPA: hypothetical protein VMV18_12250 [bacterium]|nr:hypothetical protein [bacterium]